MFTEYRLINIDLQLFADMNTQVTSSEGLTDGMKTYYSDYLIDLVEAELVHDQFAQKHPIPQHGGKTIEFRQWDTLPEMTEPITEGVTPDGQSLSMSTIEATVEQYGGYVTVSDMLELTHIDPVVVQATKAIASQAGRSLDTITREVLNAGTVVQYAEGQVDSRSKLAYTSKTDNHNLTVAAIKKAVRFLENQNAPKINGYYVGILHPFTKYDLMNDPEWQKPHQYCDTENIYANEIGEIAGVRFVQSTRAKKFEGAGASGADVYATLILADDAYGVTEITGGGLEHIVKQRGSAGTADPLNQRATAGWKAIKTAVRLVETYMVRLETCSTYNGDAN